MTKFLTASALTGLALAAFALPASAITNEADCVVEGGVMVAVKGSDYCLVPIRDEAYADPIYDGNQLGVVECPGDKLNDGQYCMYPVTIRPEIKPMEVAPVAVEDGASETVMDKAMDMATDKVEDMAKDKAEDMMKDKAKDMAKEAIK